MASACRRFMTRRTMASLKSFTKPPASSLNQSSIPSSTSSPLRCFFSGCPSELACLQSLLPLHSAVAGARMTSCLSSSSRSCRALSQDGIDELGLSVPR